MKLLSVKGLKGLEGKEDLVMVRKRPLAGP